jgi:uncharacterized protein (TIGR03000 family)
MESTGTTRYFRSPPLEQNRRYTYRIRARWKEEGRMIAQTQRVHFHAGDGITVAFPVVEEEKIVPPKE